MNKFKIGEVVKHDFSEEEGTVTDLRDDAYSVYVKWDNQPERNDWYKPEVLLKIRGSEALESHPAIELTDVGFFRRKPSDGSYDAHRA